MKKGYKMTIFEVKNNLGVEVVIKNTVGFPDDVQEHGKLIGTTLDEKYALVLLSKNTFPTALRFEEIEIMVD